MAERLEITGVSHSFGGLVVASDISFSLARGSRTALIGPNGAGKTTLINLISGALSPQSGDIRLDGRSVVGLDQAARAQAGIVRSFQVGRLFRDLTVADNIRLPLIQRRRERLRLWPSKSGAEEIEREVGQLLDAFRLAGASSQLARELPYGEQRLVEIAIALALKPRVLLLDEPAAGVPHGESGIILDVIAGLPRDLSVLLIEHDMDLVFRFADRIIVLVNGTVLLDGAPAEVAANDQVKQIYFGRTPHVSARH
jgi:branched-chain amino acid transport system ATP-binding protein